MTYDLEHHGALVLSWWLSVRQLGGGGEEVQDGEERMGVGGRRGAVLIAFRE